MARTQSILTFRPLATVLVLTSMAGASLGHVEVMRDCDACPLRAATAGKVGLGAPVAAHDCCSPDAGDQKPDSRPQKDAPGRCPVTCASCCMVQGRTIAPDAPVVPLDHAAAVGAEPAPLPTLTLPAGVGRSVFHPPRA